MKTYTVKPNDANQRLDKFIRKAFTKISLPSIFKYIRTKRVKVNGKKATIDYQLQVGDKVELYINDVLMENSVNKNDFMLAKDKLDVVYEDENIIVVNKPIGVVVQDDNTKTVDTLCNRLLKYLFNKKTWDPQQETSFTPAFVHRLDRNTQGLIIGAKNVIAARVLSQKIKDHEIDKYYLAHVYGIIDPKNGTLHDYLTKDTRKDIKGNFVKITKKPISKDSKEIVTEYKTLSYDKTTSVIEIHLITGKTHQIRAHMNYIKHPLVGERKYTTDLYEKNDDIYQSLISYKIIFNFKTDALSLNYLKNKTISLTINKQTFFV